MERVVGGLTSPFLDQKPLLALENVPKDLPMTGGVPLRYP
jgi:hypothetical protein